MGSDEAATTQPAATPQMGLISEVTQSYDNYVADVFGIGKAAYEAKGIIPQKKGQWTSGYIGIHNPAVCCLSCCCRPCCYGMLRADFVQKKDWIPDCILNCFIGCPLQWVNRVAIRQKYDIQGSVLGDGIYTCLCGPCAIAQERSEVDARNKKGFKFFFLMSSNDSDTGIFSMFSNFKAKYNLRSPGSFENLHRESKMTFPALFQIEGVKVDIASILSENFNIVHSFQWGSQMNPGVYQFGATFTDPKFVIGGQLDHAGTLNGKFCYNWIPIPVPSHNPETPKEPAPEVTSTTKIQGQGQIGSNQKVLVFEHEHLGKDYSLSLRATNPVLFGKRSEQIMTMIPENYSIGFLQSISPSFIIGGELSIPKGDFKSRTATYALKYVPPASKIEPPPVLPDGIPSPYMPVNPKDPSEALTVSVSPSSGLIQTSYWKKINQRLDVATEVQLLADQASGRREGIAMLGWKLDTIFATIRSSIDTQGRISTVLEERIAPGISLQLSADMNYGKSLGGEGKVGIGFTMEQ